MPDLLEHNLLEHCDLYDEVVREEEFAVAVAKHTIALDTAGLVFLGTLHGTHVKGIPGAVLVADSGWTLGTGVLSYWLEHDETGEMKHVA